MSRPACASSHTCNGFTIAGGCRSSIVSHSLTDIIFLTERSWRIADGRLQPPVAPQDLLTGFGSAAGESVLNVLNGTVASRARVGPGTPSSRARASKSGCPTRACASATRSPLALPARDVLLSLAPPSGLSARNSLQATIRRLSLNGAALWAVVEVGATPLMVELTPDAGRDLHLRTRTERSTWSSRRTRSASRASEEPKPMAKEPA